MNPRQLKLQASPLEPLSKEDSLALMEPSPALEQQFWPQLHTCQCYKFTGQLFVNVNVTAPLFQHVYCICQVNISQGPQS